MRFRKKPVEIDAVTVKFAIKCAESNWKNLPKWLADAYEKGNILFCPKTIFIYTPEGQMLTSFDDWIIKGVNGEIYPCKPDIFEATYEPVVE